MRTTFNIDDGLLRQANKLAADEGNEGLELIAVDTNGLVYGHREKLPPHATAIREADASGDLVLDAQIA